MTDTIPNRVVHLTLQQAKEGMKDLLRYDAQKSIDSIRIAQISDLKTVIELMTKEKAIIEERERNFKLAFDSQKLLSQDWESKYKQVKKSANRSKFWGWVKTGGGIVIGALIGKQFL